MRMWMPTRLKNEEGWTGREETRRGNAPIVNRQAPVQSTGVMSTACREGDLQRVGEARVWRRSRLRTSPERAAARLGVGEGRMTDEAG